MGHQYSPGEVTAIARISKNTLLAWERDGKIDQVHRDAKNHRFYSPEQVSSIVRLAGICPRRRIAVVNQKGGVGKTTATFNLGACLARQGMRVLLVDLDAQANLTISFGINPDEIDKTSNDLLVNEDVRLEDVVLPTEFPNLHIVPADIRLAGADVKLKEMIMRERILDSKLQDAYQQYNFMLFDCPPNLSSITINALVACTDTIVPVETQFYSMKAIDDLTSTLNLIKKKMNHSIRTWILPMKIDRRIKMHQGILAMLQKNFGGKLLTPIVTDAKLGSAPMIKQPVIYSFPGSRSAADFRRLCREVLDHESQIGGDVRDPAGERDQAEPEQPQPQQPEPEQQQQEQEQHEQERQGAI